MTPDGVERIFTQALNAQAKHTIGLKCLGVLQNLDYFFIPEYEDNLRRMSQLEAISRNAKSNKKDPRLRV
jgi:hypothetical protein